MVTLLIKDNSYSMTPKLAKICVKTAKDAMKGHNAIVAVERQQVVQMKNEVFQSKSELMKKAKEYINSGFKVTYVMVG